MRPGWPQSQAPAVISHGLANHTRVPRPWHGTRHGLLFGGICVQGVDFAVSHRPAGCWHVRTQIPKGSLTLALKS